MQSARSIRAVQGIRSHVARAILIGTTLGALAGCGGTSEPSVPPKDVIPSTIVPTSTDTLRGVVAGAVNSGLTVTVKNTAGEPIDSAVVTFAVVTGGGAVNPTNTRTNSTGQATTAWTLGPTTGVQTVTATVGSLSPVTYTAVATAGAAAKLTVVAGGTAQSAVVGTDVGTPPSVKVTDAPGNPVAGAVVTFAVTAGGGLVNPGQVTTGADGVATVVSWRLGTAVGANTLTATTGAVTPVIFSATATVGPAATLTLTPQGSAQLNLGGTVTLAARVVDAAGNVLTNPTVTFTSSNESVASVSTAGVITATGAGTSTITATSGTATANFAVTVIGHPVGTGITKTLMLGATPGDVAFTKDATLVAANGLNEIVILDAEVVNSNGPVVTVTGGVPILLAGTRTSGPAVAVSVGVSSRVWFVDLPTAAVQDSADIQEIVSTGVIKSDGSRAFFLLNSGEVQPVDVATHTVLPRISLGGIPTKLRLDQGDTLAYVLTTVGIMFEIDARTNAVRRQINLGTNGAVAPDFAISADGNSLYLLDRFNSVIRIIDLTTNTLQRLVGIEAGANTIALSPDGQQIWLTHATQVSIYRGSLANGYLAGANISMSSLPIRIYFSPTGSFAAITNIGGWVDIVR